MNIEDMEIIMNKFSRNCSGRRSLYKFFRYRSFTNQLPDFPNLVVLQTLSKAWGLAALRLGIAFSSAAIIEIMNKINLLIILARHRRNWHCRPSTGLMK